MPCVAYQFSPRSSLVLLVRHLIAIYEQDEKVLVFFAHDGPFAHYFKTIGHNVCCAPNVLDLLSYSTILCIGFEGEIWQKYFQVLCDKLHEQKLIFIGCDFGSDFICCNNCFDPLLLDVSPLVESIGVGAAHAVVTEHEKAIRFHYDFDVAFRASQILVDCADEEIAVIADDFNILSMIQLRLLKHNINFCYCRPLIMDGMVTFTLQVVDCLIYNLNLPFYSNMQDNAALKALIGRLKESFDGAVLLQGIECVLGHKFQESIRNILWPIRGFDVFEYRIFFSHVSQEHFFFIVDYYLQIMLVVMVIHWVKQGLLIKPEQF